MAHRVKRRLCNGWAWRAVREAYTLDAEAGRSVAVRCGGRRSWGMERIYRHRLHGGEVGHCMTCGPSNLDSQGVDPS